MLQDGIAYGEKDPRKRLYLCRAEKKGERKYEFEFLAKGDATKFKAFSFVKMSSDPGILDVSWDEGEFDFFRIETLNKTRSAEEKAAIGRFVEQQTETDPVIQQAIEKRDRGLTFEEGAAENLEKDDGLVFYPMVFLRSRGANILYSQVGDLLSIGQVMYIPGLVTPHAGGVGLYLPEAEKPLSDKAALEAVSLQGSMVWKIFAKAGWPSEECRKMQVVYYKWLSGVFNTLYPDIDLAKYLVETVSPEEERLLLEKAQTATFADRMKDPSKVDYYDKKDEALNETIVDAAAREVTDYARERKPVVFVPQGYLPVSECEAVLKDFKGAEFVQFNPQAADVGEELLGKITDGRYKDRDKAVITIELEFDQVEKAIRENERTFNSVRLMNFYGDIPVGRPERTYAQKGILTLALLARALPQERYQETSSYMVLLSMLRSYLPDNKEDAEEYIVRLVKRTPFLPDIDYRFSFIINCMLRAITPVKTEELRQAIDLFISA